MMINETGTRKLARGVLAIVICLLLLACAVNNKQKFPAKDLKSTTEQIISGAATDTQKLERLFLFVRDEIDFNWGYPEDLPPQVILNIGSGVCMQKANLLSAMARKQDFRRVCALRMCANRRWRIFCLLTPSKDGRIRSRIRWLKSCIRESGDRLIHLLMPGSIKSVWIKKLTLPAIGNRPVLQDHFFTGRHEGRAGVLGNQG